MSSQGPKIPLVLTALVVLCFGGVAAFSQFAPAKAIPWSDAATWRTAHQLFPQRGAEVIIPAGQTVVLDTCPPPLSRLTINGTLIVPDTADACLEVAQMEVNGTFQVGTQNAPFGHRFTLILAGTESAEARLFVQNNGRLEWFGADPGASWLHLGATAPRGTSTLTLENAVPCWKVGDRIVLASTDFDAHQAEERTITGVKDYEVTLNAPLVYTHWGQTENGVDERGEVALLSRHIVVRGSQKGGCVMMMAGSVARFSAVEFTQLGMRGQKGRYPVHFHQVGDASESFVQACSIHHCFNRSLTIHGTRHLRVFNNVSFDTIGHAYFLEDGDETKNELVHNLGLLTRAALPGEAVLPSDVTPATFWITNPDNVVSGNVAAGSDYHGFWYSLPKHPTGLAQSDTNDRTAWPRHTPLGAFTNNTAHSNVHSGLFVDNGPNAPGETETPNYQPRQNAVPTVGGKNSPPVLAVFDTFTAYKNRRRGAWMRGDHLRLVHAKLADNSIGATLAASESLVQNSLIVGETANIGTAADGENTGQGGRTLPKPNEPQTPLCGFEFYDGLVGIQNTTFVHFRTNEFRPAGALGVLRYSPYYLNPQNFAEGLHFADANAVYLADKNEPGDPRLSGDGYRSALFQDRDGSITKEAGSVVSVLNPLLQNDMCRFNADWNAAVCSNHYAHFFVDNRDKQPFPVGPVSFVRDNAVSSVPYRVFGSPTEGNKPAGSFQTNLLVGDTYRAAFTKQAPNTFRLTLRDCRPGDWVIVGMKGKQGETAVVREGSETGRVVPEAPSRAELQNANVPAIFRDPADGTVYVKLTTTATTARTGAAVVVSHPSRPRVAK